MIVMVGEVDAPPDALGDPLLVQPQAGIIGNAQIKERRHSAHMEIKAIPGSGSLQALP